MCDIIYLCVHVVLIIGHRVWITYTKTNVLKQFEVVLPNMYFNVELEDMV